MRLLLWRPLWHGGLQGMGTCIHEGEESSSGALELCFRSEGRRAKLQGHAQPKSGIER